MVSDSKLQQLVTYSDPRSPAAEAYRQLRTNIQFAGLDKVLKSILITGASLDEGKSTTLANLGVAFSQTGSSVILLDCDLRRPSLHELFGLDNLRGITTWVVDGTADTVPLLDSGIPNLSLMLSGPPPPNPSELLGSRRMSELLNQLCSRADYVLIDTPPVVAVTDAAVLANKVDAVLLLVRAGKTKRDMARRAKVILERVNANLLGVILNNVRYDSKMHGY